MTRSGRARQLVVDDSVVVEIDSVRQTRAALATDDENHVVGWVDLTSPHLVDLLDELLTGPGGHRLVAIRSSAVAEHLDELPVRRGLSTLQDLHLAFHTLDLDLRSVLADRWPLLRLHP